MWEYMPTGTDMSLVRSFVDVALSALVLYRVLLLLRGSRAGVILVVIAALFAGYYASQEDVLDLPTLHWLLDKFFGSVVVLVIVLFQADIRRALAGLRRAPLVYSSRDPESTAVIEEILRACQVLAERRIGALIVIERHADLARYVNEGVRVGADTSWELLISLFVPTHENPTHDGAVILQKGRIAAAACFLPLASERDLDKSLGTRHRAALGLAEETDAVIIVVSEENGLCALAHDGQLERRLGPGTLRDRVQALFGDPDRSRVARRKRRWGLDGRLTDLAANTEQTPSPDRRQR